MSRISLKTPSTLQHTRDKWLKKDLRLKPFGFCCSLDHFDPLTRYDQRMPPYKSSLTAITSVHECPVIKLQTKFIMPRLSREKKKLPKTKASDMVEHQWLKNSGLNYTQFEKNNRFIKRYLEDEIALAKDIFWAEKRKIHEEKISKAIKTAKKKNKKYSLKLKTYPRWYQDFSPDQIKNLMKLENVMHIDYEETKTHGTQTTLIAIGVISTFFQLKPSTIKELHKLCNLNSVDFLREIYRILTGNDFCEEGYKKVYNCNERIILSAIAFLTLPETVKELHKRLPAVTMPKLPPKPKLITCMPRRKNICPYKEELFTRPDWASYRNALQKWRKHCKLIAIPKVILPLNEYYGQSFINKKLEITKGERDITTEHFDKINIKELQKVSSTMYDQKDFKDADSSRERNLNSEELATSNIFGLPDNGKKFDFIRNLDEKPEIAEYKICDLSKPLEEIQKSWLEKKDPVTYEMEVANVTPSNSDERFFAVLKLGDRTKKVFPSGRENLSINWQEWLQHVDENYWQLEEKTDELIKSVQTIFKSTFPESVCDSCCLCRQIKKLEKLQQNKIDKTLISEEKNTDLMAMQSSEQNQAGSLINQVASEDKIKTNIIINEVTTEAEQIQNHIMGIQEDKIHVLQKFEPPASSISVRNIPSCLCAIQQMTDKGISLSVSKEDIPWTKEEGLCPGRKYRPNEAGAYSCKTYPGDKFCRHNPFIKEMMKMEREKIEKLEELKEKTEFIEAVKKETLVPKKNIFEKKTVKFNFDSDYPVYDDSWNISRTAPSKVTKTDYETPLKLTSSTYKIVMQSLNKENSNKIEKYKEIDKVVREKNEYSEETVGKIDHQQNISHKQVIDKTEEKIDERSHRINDDKKYINNNSDLIAIVKAELQKMAVEGYIFAKLPKCYLMPQLQDWIMYREGVAFSETDKKNLMQATRAVWDLINLHIPREIEKPSLHMTKPQLKRLTYDQVERMKKKIGKVKAIFHSKVRKARVSYCRMMWKTMEYGKFPSASFKRTFFTYMASKEADGHVYKPWLPSEIHQRDFSFCC